MPRIRPNRRLSISAGTVLYLLVGVIFAINRGYALHTPNQIADFLFAVVFWPLIWFLGLHFYFHLPWT